MIFQTILGVCLLVYSQGVQAGYHYHYNYHGLLKTQLTSTIDVLTPSYEVSFDVKPVSRIHGAGNLIHLTTGGNVGKLGDRAPGVWFQPWNTRLNICSAIDANPNNCFSTNYGLPYGVFSHVRILQRLVNNQYVYYIFINGRQVYSKVNKSPYIFRKVKVYASDPWSTPASAIIENLNVQYNTNPLAKQWLKRLEGKRIAIQLAPNAAFWKIIDNKGNLGVRKNIGDVFYLKVVSPFQVALKSPHHKFVTALPSGQMIANSDTIGENQKFDIIFLNQNQIGLYSVPLTKFVKAKPSGVLKTVSPLLEEYQTFNVIIKDW